MDSIDHHLPSSLVCPAERIKYLKSRIHKEIGKQNFLIVDNSYYISNAEDDESSRSDHLLALIECNNKERNVHCMACRDSTIVTTYYFCNECDKCYHKECVESPPMLKSPYHPKHLLQLHKKDDLYVLSGLECLSCSSCVNGLVYHCSSCDFSVDPVCVRKLPLINHKKRHEHTLYFFPRTSRLTCDLCGLDDNKSFVFLCLHCDFVVHKKCIYLPHVIKISRHRHRLSFVSSLPSRKWSCGICRQKIDENYGAYSCMAKDCIYGAHSICATRPNVWDGRELEEEPEEVNESIKPSFEEISDGVILHFSHSEHPMRLGEDTKILYDETKVCLACMLPLHDGKAYTCMECDFVLHEACAYLPRVIQHALHAHSLTLEHGCTQRNISCDICCRESFGFKYVCYNGCYNWIADVRCASIYEPYNHHSHRHPLFITKLYVGRSLCSICAKTVFETLNCDECGFVLCFGCANLPYKMRYKDDEHFLTLSYEQGPNGVYWCELCEGTIYQDIGFYGCNECDVTLHTKCLLGVDLYTNPGSRVKVHKMELNIVHNSALTRPICSGCRRRCEYKVMFVASSGDIYCSLDHI